MTSISTQDDDDDDDEEEEEEDHGSHSDLNPHLFSPKSQYVI